MATGEEAHDTMSLVPLVSQEVREVDFDGDPLLIGVVDGVPYVALRPIVEFLGIEWSAQTRRIRRDDILSEETRLVAMLNPRDNKIYEMLSLPIDFLHGWIFGITGSRLKTKEAAEKLRKYRRDCFRVLWREFGQLSLVPAEPVVESVLVQVRDAGLAIVQMAQAQLELQGTVGDISVRTEAAHERLDKAALVVGNMQRRLTTVERRVLPYECVSPEQAADISLAVKRLGEALTRKAARGSSKEKIPNYYQGIFTEIYNRTGAPRYELIRQEDYVGVMQFLEDWSKSAQERGE